MSQPAKKAWNGEKHILELQTLSNIAFSKNLLTAKPIIANRLATNNKITFSFISISSLMLNSNILIKFLQAISKPVKSVLLFFYTFNETLEQLKAEDEVILRKSKENNQL